MSMRCTGLDCQRRIASTTMAQRSSAPIEPADDQRQTLAWEMPELTPFGFDLPADGDADERDEDQRAGGGDATPAQLAAETWL